MRLRDDATPCFIRSGLGRELLRARDYLPCIIQDRSHAAPEGPAIVLICSHSNLVLPCGPAAPQPHTDPQAQRCQLKARSHTDRHRGGVIKGAFTGATWALPIVNLSWNFTVKYLNTVREWLTLLIHNRGRRLSTIISRLLNVREVQKRSTKLWKMRINNAKRGIVLDILTYVDIYKLDAAKAYALQGTSWSLIQT